MRALALCLAAVLALVTFHAGRSYVWCVPMHRPMPSCCLEARRELSLDQRGVELSAQKSELRSFGHVPPGRDGAAGELEAPATALLVSRYELEPIAARASLPRIAPAVVRPQPFAIGPPAASERRALLQVFHC